MLLQGPGTRDEDRLIGGVGHQGLIETSGSPEVRNRREILPRCSPP